MSTRNECYSSDGKYIMRISLDSESRDDTIICISKDTHNIITFYPNILSLQECYLMKAVLRFFNFRKELINFILTKKL